MKFSAALKFNAVSEWWDEYIAYDTLKRCIYQLEKQQHPPNRSSVDLEANEHTALVESSNSLAADAIFIPLLDKELMKIVLFYEHQEKELMGDLAELEELVAEQDATGLSGGDHYMDYGDDDDDDDDDDDEHIGEHVRFEHGSRRRSRKSSSAGYSRRSTSGTRRGHRWSISSSEGVGGDLENSTLSLTQRSSSLAPPGSRGPNPSRSPMGRVRLLTNKIRGVQDSTISMENESVWTAKTNYAWDIRFLFKRRITNLFASFSSLRSYIELNYSGFRKILKKYDKVLYNELQDRYLRGVVEEAVPFTQNTKDKLNSAINQLVALYAKCVTHGDHSAAHQQLKLYVRENIAWERNTVWRQMIGQERRGALSPDAVVLATVPGYEEKGVLRMKTPFGHLKLKLKYIHLLMATSVFILLLNVKMVDNAEANKCLAILVFSTILWATEAIPLFVTSTLVPLLLVIFRVIRAEDGSAMSANDATKWIFSVMFSPTIMLLIGGFTISSALSKTNIDRMLITWVLSLAGSDPNTVLLAFMGVSCFASMWISNVAAPTLCFALIRPILRTLPPHSPFGPCLVLAIALAANIGGQSSPISSPQNLIALQAMDPKLDWTSWFAVALPVSIISILLIWLLLLVSYKPARSPDGEGDIEVKTIRPTKEAFTLKQYWVICVCLMTIVLWCVEHQIEDVVGDMGIIAILPIVAFFATGVLKKDDFEQFAWTIVFLAMGGIALGKAVTSSGLLSTADDNLYRLLEGKRLYTIVLLLSVAVLVISTFISHTIASVLLVPIAKEVGKNLPGGDRSNLLIFITALICSAGMGMPVSGFPNQTAATQEDDLGRLYLTNVDFLKNGVPASIIATLVVATVGFVLMTLVGL
ncbi:SPX domain-containing protein [Scleroderma citrinum]